jgi:hypothetical protein
MKDIPLPDDQGVLLEMYDAGQFSRDVIASFPELRAELVQNAGLLHVQMGTLATAVRKGIASGDLVLALQVCVFLDTLLANPRAHAEIENAVAISFLEAVELRNTTAGRSFLDQLPARIREILREQEIRYGA